MAKVTGITAQIQVDSSVPTLTDISNGVLSRDLKTPRSPYVWTGQNKSAEERTLLLADASVDLKGAFDTTVTTGSHAVLSTIPSTTVVRTVTITVASKVLTNEMLGLDYVLTRGQDGKLEWSVPFVLADGAVPTWA